MKTRSDAVETDELRPEYDFARMKGGVRGKHAKAFGEGAIMVLLAPDVAKLFPDARSVNGALRTLMRASRRVVSHSR